MKKIFLLGSISICLLVTACNNDNKQGGTHLHDDGTTHTDHDTTKPEQQEFTIDSVHRDTTAKPHTHNDGEKHSH
jgi:hypothetical protein